MVDAIGKSSSASVTRKQRFRDGVLIGVIADAVSLRVALLVVVLAGIGAMLLGRLLRTTDRAA